MKTEDVFKSASRVQEEVLFAQSAISVAPAAVDTTPLWYIVIKGLSELALYEDAYATLMSTPYDRLYEIFLT
jgi:nuclear pore complex protein Nup160